MNPDGSRPDGKAPEGNTPPEFSKGKFPQQPSFEGEPPKGMEGFGRPGRGEGGMWHPGNNIWDVQELMAEFDSVEGGNVFSNVAYLNQEI